MGGDPPVGAVGGPAGQADHAADRCLTAHVTADLGTVRVGGGELVAEHARCWARHQTLTDAGHRAAAARMRGAYGA